MNAYLDLLAEAAGVDLEGIDETFVERAGEHAVENPVGYEGRDVGQDGLGLECDFELHVWLGETQKALLLARVGAFAQALDDHGDIARQAECEAAG